MQISITISYTWGLVREFPVPLQSPVHRPSLNLRGLETSCRCCGWEQSASFRGQHSTQGPRKQPALLLPRCITPTVTMITNPRWASSLAGTLQVSSLILLWHKRLSDMHWTPQNLRIFSGGVVRIRRSVLSTYFICPGLYFHRNPWEVDVWKQQGIPCWLTTSNWGGGCCF